MRIGSPPPLEAAHIVPVDVVRVGEQTSSPSRRSISADRNKSIAGGATRTNTGGVKGLPRHRKPYR
jgi:hypothetical protein